LRKMGQCELSYKLAHGTWIFNKFSRFEMIA
jgi:hypothetical protein